VFFVFWVSRILGLLLFYVVSTSAVDCLERPFLIVSDIAIFVLKRDVKLQLTN